MQQVIYLIQGKEASEYRHAKWIVKAYETRDAAETEASRMQDTMAAMNQKYQDDWTLSVWDEEDSIKAIDSQCEPWCFPVRYNVIEVPLCK